VFTDTQVDRYFRGDDQDDNNIERKPTQELISLAIDHLNSIADGNGSIIGRSEAGPSSLNQVPEAEHEPTSRSSPKLRKKQLARQQAVPQKEPEVAKELGTRSASAIRAELETNTRKTPKSRDDPKTVKQSAEKEPAIPWNLKEKKEKDGERVNRMSTSWYELGEGVHRVFKGLGNTNRRLVFHLIMVLTTFTLFLRKYAKYYLSRKSKKKKKRAQTPIVDNDAATPKSAYLGTWVTYFVYTVNTIAFLFLVWKALNHFEVSFDLRTTGLINCNEVTFPPSSRLHAWHILPPTSANLTMSEVLYRGLPVILHVRNEGSLGEQHRVNILKSLSLNNFHVLAPVSPLSDLQTIKIWEHLTKVSNNSVYPWFDHSDIGLIKKLASTMCDQGHHPSGIIMETKKMASIRFHSMEVWSSSCKNDNAHTQGVPRTFKFLKCPTSPDGGIATMQEDVGSCLRAMDSTAFLSA